MNTFWKNLKSEFPKTPESFRERVRTTVTEQTGSEPIYLTGTEMSEHGDTRQRETGIKEYENIRRTETGTAEYEDTRQTTPGMTEYENSRRTTQKKSTTATSTSARHSRRKSVPKLLIPLAACLVLACGTAAAATLPVFQRFLDSLGVNGPSAEELIIHEIASGDTEPLLAVTDAYFDGSVLMFWAIPSDGVPAPLDFGDHVFINDTDNRLEYVVETEEGSGIYECKVTIMDENLMNAEQKALDVTVKVHGMPEEKQEVSFRIASDKLRRTETAPDKVIEFSYGTVEITDLHTAPSAVKFNLKWTLYDEDAKNMIYRPEYILEDDSGNRRHLSRMQSIFGSTFETYDEAAKCWEFTQEIEVRDFDSASEYMILIPSVVETDDEGNYLYDEAAPLEEMRFEIPLHGN